MRYCRIKVRFLRFLAHSPPAPPKMMGMDVEGIWKDMEGYGSDWGDVRGCGKAPKRLQKSEIDCSDVVVTAQHSGLITC